MDALTPIEQDAAGRLEDFYNNGVQTAANPGGFDGDGHLANFIPSLQDVSTVAKALVRILYSTLSEMEQLAEMQRIAAVLIEGGPLSSFNGMTGAITFELPRVLAPANSTPANGATATLVAGALTLSVVAFSSLYAGTTQKSRQAQISTAADFAPVSVVWDSLIQTGPQLFVTLANAQATLTGGTTYYFRFRQTAAQAGQADFTSDWSAPTSFVFPQAPNAPGMTTPSNGATGQGAQNNAIAFAASDYAHPNGVARASRVFEISASFSFAAIVTSVTAASGVSNASLAAPKSVLQPDTLYYVRCRDTDANGGTNTSAATSFRTVLAFRPNVGDAYLGGYYVGQINDGGTIFDLIVAPKSGGETAAVAYYTSSDGYGTAISRTKGPANSSAKATTSHQASYVCNNLILNGYDDWYLPAIDELEIAYGKFKPTSAANVATAANAYSVPAGEVYTATIPAQTGVAVFQTGNSEAFDDVLYWSSTEAAASTALRVNFSSGLQQAASKAVAIKARAFRRVAA